MIITIKKIHFVLSTHIESEFMKTKFFCDYKLNTLLKGVVFGVYYRVQWVLGEENNDCLCIGGAAQ